MVIAVDDETQMDGVMLDSIPELPPTTSPEIIESYFAQLDLSLFLMGWIFRPKTMKMHGQIVDTQIIFMIDSGVSHCFFFFETMVQNLSLPVQSTSSFSVK